MRELIKNITKKEWYFLAIISIILIAVIIAPTVYGFLITPQNHQFTGIKMPNAGDYWVFYSRIEQSRQGHLFHQYLYSSEPSPRILFFPFWSIAGLTGKIFGLTSQQTFYFFEIILIPILIISLYLLIGYFVKDPLWKKITLLAALFTTGSDWLFWPYFLKYTDWMGIDVNLPDGHVFTAIHHSPHLSFILIGICLLFISLFLLVEAKKIGYSWLAGIMGALIFLTHPFQVIPILSLVIAYLLYEVFIKKNYQLILKLLPFIILVMLTGVYLFLLWYNFDFIKSWNANNKVAIKKGFYTILLLLSTYNVFLLLALYKIKSILKEKEIRNYLFLICWLTTGFISICLPIQWRFKMILGLSIPIAILGSLGLKLFLSNKSLIVKMIIIWTILVLTLPSGLYLLGYNVNVYKQNSKLSWSEYYFPTGTIWGLEWLKNTPEDSIITSQLYGTVIPAYSGRKTFWGSSYETIDFFHKYRETVKFYQGEYGNDFLKKYKINYLIDNKSVNIPSRDYLELIYSNPEVNIYKVKK